jgi:hypothetical protein
VNDNIESVWNSCQNEKTRSSIYRGFWNQAMVRSVRKNLSQLKTRPGHHSQEILASFPHDAKASESHYYRMLAESRNALSKLNLVHENPLMAMQLMKLGKSKQADSPFDSYRHEIFGPALGAIAVELKAGTQQGDSYASYQISQKLTASHYQRILYGYLVMHCDPETTVFSILQKKWPYIVPYEEQKLSGLVISHDFLARGDLVIVDSKYPHEIRMADKSGYVLRWRIGVKDGKKADVFS